MKPSPGVVVSILIVMELADRHKPTKMPQDLTASVSILVVMELADRPESHRVVHAGPLVEVSILVVMELADRRRCDLLVSRGPLMVSILVVMELADRRPARRSHPADFPGFNPCCDGTG